MAFILQPATYVWLGLLLATFTTGWLAEAEQGIRWAVVAMLLIASAKIWLIQRHFMELKVAPIAWRVGMGAWLLAVTTIVLSDYWLG